MSLENKVEAQVSLHHLLPSSFPPCSSSFLELTLNSLSLYNVLAEWSSGGGWFLISFILLVLLHKSMHINCLSPQHHYSSTLCLILSCKLQNYSTFPPFLPSCGRPFWLLGRLTWLLQEAKFISN